MIDIAQIIAMLFVSGLFVMFVGMARRNTPGTIIDAIIQPNALLMDLRDGQMCVGRKSRERKIDGDKVIFSVWTSHTRDKELPPIDSDKIKRIGFPTTSHKEGMIILMPERFGNFDGFIYTEAMHLLREKEKEMRHYAHRLETQDELLLKANSVSASRDAMNANIRSFKQLMDGFVKAQKDLKRHGEFLTVQSGKTKKEDKE